MEYTVEQAEAQFEQLVEKAEAGEEIVILREGGRIALVSIERAPERTGSRP